MWAAVGPRWPFESQDPSDRPDWKGERLQPGDLGGLRGSPGPAQRWGKHTGRASGRPRLVLPLLEQSRQEAGACLQTLLSATQALTQPPRAGSGHLRWKPLHCPRAHLVTVPSAYLAHTLFSESGSQCGAWHRAWHRGGAQPGSPEQIGTRWPCG